MRFRKLRIAWSIFWGMAAVLLIVLWVRSHDTWDAITCQLASGQKYHIASCHGTLAFSWLPKADPQGKPWVDPFGNELYPVFWDQWPVVKWSKPVDANGELVVFTVTNPSWPAEAHSFPSVSARYWCLVLLSATFATVPWTGILKYRFTLRTLLIATTLVAVVLGAIVYAVN